LSVARTDDLDKVLGPLGAEVMRAVWKQREPMTPRQALDVLNDGRTPPLAYTTVMTVMSRLAEKGILVRRRARRGFAYEAVAKDAAAIAVHDVMRDFGEQAVAHFLTEARADPKLRRRLERLLEEK
jgi:predicted transcriptional regulator